MDGWTYGAGLDNKVGRRAGENKGRRKKEGVPYDIDTDVLNQPPIPSCVFSFGDAYITHIHNLCIIALGSGLYCSTQGVQGHLLIDLSGDLV